MNTAENPQTTTLKFIESWRLQDPDRLTAELISIHKETNRRPDTYNFEIKDGLLIDPETQKPILDFIAKGSEYQIAERLQGWADENEEGLAYWISPKLEGKYPCNKMIIHRIAYDWNGTKNVLNSAILFDAKLEDADYLRQTLFTTEDNEENVFKLLSWIDQVAEKYPDKAEGDHESIRSSARYFADQILLGVPDYLIVQEMKEKGFLGENSISCAGGEQTFSEYIDGKSTTTLLGNGKDNMGGLSFTCPACGHVNTREPGKLLFECQNSKCPDRSRVRC